MQQNVPGSKLSKDWKVDSRHTIYSKTNLRSCEQFLKCEKRLNCSLVHHFFSQWRDISVIKVYLVQTQGTLGDESLSWVVWPQWKEAWLWIILSLCGLLYFFFLSFFLFYLLFTIIIYFYFSFIFNFLRILIT